MFRDVSTESVATVTTPFACVAGGLVGWSIGPYRT